MLGGCFMAIMTTAAATRSVNMAALGASLFFLVFGPVYVWIAVRGTGTGIWETLRVFLPSAFAAAISMAATALVIAFLPDGQWWDVARLIAGALLAIAIYIPLIRIFSPAEAAEVGMHLRERIPQRFRTRRAGD
jgi:hypothetical protein